jgi:hypothetical protein
MEKENKKEEFAIALKCPYEIVEDFLRHGATKDEIVQKIMATMSKDLEKFVTSYVDYVEQKESHITLY